MPVPPISATQPSATASSLKQERKKTSTSRPSEHADPESRKRTPQSIDGDSTSHYPSRQTHTNDWHKEPAHTRPRSETSGASSYIFQSSLLGPPKTSTSRPSEHTDPESRKRTPQSIDGDSTSHYPSRQTHTNDWHKEPANTRPRSETSGASSYIFQSSLLGPPNIGKKENNEEADYFTAGARRIWSPSEASTQFERIPLKRPVNPTMPPSPSLPQSSLDRYNETMHGNFIIEVSGSFHYTPLFIFLFSSLD
jgi:hypothetical protein